MIIILDGKGIGKGGVWYIDFEEAIEKRATRRLGLRWGGGEKEVVYIGFGTT